MPLYRAPRVSLHQSRFIYFENIVFTSFVTDKQTDGRTSRQYHASCLSSLAENKNAFIETLLDTLLSLLYGTPCHSCTTAVRLLHNGKPRFSNRLVATLAHL